MLLQCLSFLLSCMTLCIKHYVKKDWREWFSMQATTSVSGRAGAWKKIGLLWKMWKQRESLLWKGMRGASTEESMRKLRFLSLTQPQALLERRVIHFIWKHGRMSQGTWDLLDCEFAPWFSHKPWLNFGYISNTKAGFSRGVSLSGIVLSLSFIVLDAKMVRNWGSGKACLLMKETSGVYVLLKNE